MLTLSTLPSDVQDARGGQQWLSADQGLLALVLRSGGQLMFTLNYQYTFTHINAVIEMNCRFAQTCFLTSVSIPMT